jgi:hypothetical protein
LGNFHFNNQDDALQSAMIPEPAASKILLAVCEERKLKKRDADIGTGRECGGYLHEEFASKSHLVPALFCSVLDLIGCKTRMQVFCRVNSPRMPTT